MTGDTHQSWSIRRRVLMWLMVGMAVVIVATLGFSYFTNQDAADSAYDRLLLASASAIAERTVVRNDRIFTDIPHVALNMLASTAQDRVFYAVLDPQGRLVTGYQNLPLPPNSSATVFDEKVQVYDATYKDVPVRILSLKSFVSGANLSGYVTVMVAQTKGERESLAILLLQQNAAWTILIAIAGAAAAWFGISNGLRPLNRLKDALGRRSPEDVRPILHDVPSEFGPLIEALNSMLFRIDIGLRGMRRFISDASHQLKTPLAGLQTQTQIALRETDPDELHQSLERMDISVRRTTRLAQQLLSHARATELQLSMKPVNLSSLIKDLVTQMFPLADSKSIDLGFDGEPHVKINGDETLLQELFTNLIDNAISYSPTGTYITVKCDNARGRAHVTVIDEGPGIPFEQRDSVFDRFVRLSTEHTEGCGLGLAIAREIIEQHNGKIWLDDAPGGGLAVHTTFKLRKYEA